MAGRRIERAAVLGSGVMGSAIAAHLANAGIPSILLVDVVPKEPTAEEARRGLTLEHPVVRNRLAREALAAARKSKPAPLFSDALAARIDIGNFEDDWERIGRADWIVEVVKEDLAIKRRVLESVARHRRPGSIVSTNTSGISIAAMAQGFDDDFRRHFVGTHFFNPPRYLQLLEIIPGPDTDPEVGEFLSRFAERALGKGVVVARDTPNFVANRIGVFAMLDAIRAMEELGLTIEEVDFLTGPLIGHPKSASFRTADLVGLDTFVAVAGNVHRGCPEDERRDVFEPPALLKRMIENGLLGEKSGSGFYFRTKDEDGKTRIDTLDVDTLEYREQRKARFGELEAVRGIEDLCERFKALIASKGKAAAFLWRTTSHLLAYCAHRVGEIADGPGPIDDAMKWGFGWELGPFEIWDALGFEGTAARMEQDGIGLPAWIAEMRKAGATAFRRTEGGRVAIWDPDSAAYREVPADPARISLALLKQAGRTVRSNAGASLVDLGDGVACLEFHTKMNAIGGDIVEMIGKTLADVESRFEGLVIGNQGPAFSAGANLMLILMEAQEQNWEDLDLMIRAFQRANMALKYAAKPVVVAVHGMCLGGGAEVLLHGQRAVASAESYIGLVELGAGVVPAGGGCKELYLRNLERSGDLHAVLRKTFETIGMAKVSTSAVEAVDLGFLRRHEGVTMHPAHVLADAKAAVLALAAEGLRPGSPRTDIPVLGRAGRAVLDVGLYNMVEGRYISAHDRKVGHKLAHVLSGGDLSGPATVSEQYLLDLEREAFLSLLGERKSLERMQALLKTGKPLRN